MSLFDTSFLELEDYKFLGDTDYTAAFCRVRDKALTDGHGYNVLPPSGQLCISDTIHLDFTGTTYNDLGGINITGPGSANCQLYWTKNSNEPMFSVTANSVSNGPVVNLKWSGFNAGTQRDRVGTFWSSQYAGGCEFSDITTVNFDLHWQLADSLVVDFSRCQMSWGRRGISQYRTDFTFPNAVNLNNNTCIGAMAEFAVVMDGGSNFVMNGGTIENNGYEGTSGGGIFICRPGNEGGMGAHINGVYFEGNKAKGAIYYLANPNFQSSISVTNNTFNRKAYSSALQEILLETDTGYKSADVFHEGNNITYFDGDYPGGYPMGGTGYLPMRKVGNGPGDFHGSSKYRTERPSFPEDTPHATLVLNPATMTKGKMKNIGSVVRHGVGMFSILFQTKSSGTHFLELITNGAHVHQLYNEDATYVRFHIFNLNGALVDPETLRVRVFS